jgi:hypothetical protein
MPIITITPMDIPMDMTTVIPIATTIPTTTTGTGG